MKFRVSLFFATIALSWSTYLTGQELGTGLKSFQSINVNVRITDKTTLSYGQWYITTLSGLNGLWFTMLQQKFEVDYRLSKKFRLEFTWKPSYFHYTNGTWRWIHILALNAKYTKKVNRKNLTTTLRSELFTPQQSKYRYRFILISRYYLTRYRLPGKSALYAEGRLYYYLDGRPINYYENGELVITQAPNDFHRFRTTLGWRFKTSKHTRFVLYGTWNKEFNNPFTQYREINVPSRTGNTILRDFNNYFIIGTGLSIRIDARD